MGEQGWGASGSDPRGDLLTRTAPSLVHVSCSLGGGGVFGEGLFASFPGFAMWPSCGIERKNSQNQAAGAPWPAPECSVATGYS